jgi:hypothetical protein
MDWREIVIFTFLNIYFYVCMYVGVCHFRLNFIAARYVLNSKFEQLT